MKIDKTKLEAATAGKLAKALCCDVTEIIEGRDTILNIECFHPTGES